MFPTEGSINVYTVILHFPEYLCHVYVRNDNLSAVVIADTEYPQRVCFSLLEKVRFTHISSQRRFILLCHLSSNAHTQQVHFIHITLYIRVLIPLYLS